jgi:Bacteriophage tail sheath protein
MGNQPLTTMATTYLSPGVYVEDVPPVARPIAGVGTSTAGFIGIIPDKIEYPSVPVKNALVGTGSKERKSFPLDNAYPVLTKAGTFQVRVNGEPSPDATLKNDDAKKTSSVEFTSPPKEDAEIRADYQQTFSLVAAGEVKLCTNFSEFTKFFGDFHEDNGQNMLAHAVYGFFNNGGSRCYVARESKADNIKTKSLVAFEAIDEIAIVAAPGVESVRNDLADHCKRLGDRFAILESQITDPPEGPGSSLPQNNPYAALYFPWIEVFDPATGKNILVPPSGHVAGIYARVDTQRGVHKAPANEVVSGALGLQYNLSKSHQEGLNPQGINCIRNLNGNIYVWGARTLGGDANGSEKYISTRRLLNFLRESIEEGTQFVVFEPNSPALWQRIKRSVGDFLLGQWRAGSLFGETPEEAFFVKCDAETNPPDVREAGQVVTEIGVAIVKPAEFVIFRIQQQTGG